MTFERDLFISFSGGLFSGMLILIVTYVFRLDMHIFEKIVRTILYIVLISILYIIAAFLLKKIYNKYIPWRIK